MQDESPTPLTVAAKLLRDFGDVAPYEAMNTCRTFQLQGAIESAAFWAIVVAETIDAVTAIQIDVSL